MKRYEALTDEQLLELLKEGEQEVEDYLMVRYKNLVRKKASSMYILGGETEDLIQEGMIGLVKAVRDYDFGRDSSFYTFAELCVSRQIYTAVQASNRKKHWPLNFFISLYGADEKGEGAAGETELVSNLRNEAHISNPESIVIAQENVEDIEQILRSQLSDMEKQVLELHIAGMANSETARILGRDEKSTDNALQRAKQKIKKELKKKQDFA